MNEVYDSVLLAEYLLAIGHKKRKVINVTKVQKLLYIAYGYFLSHKNRVIMSEIPRAWPYGPVFPRTREQARFYVVHSEDDVQFDEIRKDEEVKDFFEYLVDNFGAYSATQLSNWSHEKGGPWDITTKMENFSWNAPIENNLIKEYFERYQFAV